MYIGSAYKLSHTTPSPCHSQLFKAVHVHTKNGWKEVASMQANYDACTVHRTCFTVVTAWWRASPTDENETLEERQADISSKVCNTSTAIDAINKSET